MVKRVEVSDLQSYIEWDGIPKTGIYIMKLQEALNFFRKRDALSRMYRTQIWPCWDAYFNACRCEIPQFSHTCCQNVKWPPQLCSIERMAVSFVSWFLMPVRVRELIS